MREGGLRFFIDNCVGTPVARALRALDPGLNVLHITERWPSDTEDRVWLPALNDEGDWAIVTKDRGGGEERFAWRANRLPTFYLVRGWKGALLWEMAAKIITCWPTLVRKAQSAQPGETFKILRNGGIESWRLNA